MSIVINQVSKNFGPVQALQNVSLTLEEGKIYGLLGRNGAGKSTLLNILTDRIFPNGGSVTLDGAPVHNNDRALSKMYLMSEPSCYPESMKVKDAFRWTQRFYPGFDRDFAWNLAGAFELNVGAKVSKLSTGYTSIFKLIVALSVNVPYVLLDEPVLGHLIEEVASLVEDVVIIHRGQVLKNGPCEELLRQGYTVSGPRSLVETYIQGKRLLGADCLGGLESAYLLGTPDRAGLPQGLELSGLDLQKLFILMTGNPEGAFSGTPRK